LKRTLDLHLAIPEVVLQPRSPQTPSQETDSSSGDSSKPSVPSVSLPTGGGAVKGIGEKFDVNPATGTGSISIPLTTSPGRSGYGPQLSLSYSSGAGNGIFGLGWNLSIPQITRKTDKGLPLYLDCTESDVFLLSGAEDLVPVVDKNCTDECAGDQLENVRVVDGSKYQVDRYRPRIEGLFARIERWTNVNDRDDVHWRSYTKTNDLTIYGKDFESRIADPEDPTRVFSWLICESRDTKGNFIAYEYKCEDGAGVDLCNVHERNRGETHDPRRTTNRYIKRIRYGNREPALDECGNRPHFLDGKSLDWMFEVVFDYGEHDSESPTPDEKSDWLFREDTFSSYRSRFEVRTTRRCQRVLMFHHFADEEGVGKDCLVRSTDFEYDAADLVAEQAEPVYSRISSVRQAGYKRKSCGGYIRRTLPPLEFEYSRPIVQDKIESVDSKSTQNLPVGLDGSSYRWVDLHGEGISGILTEQAGNWYYKQNLSPLTTGRQASEAEYVEVVTCESVKPRCNPDVAGELGLRSKPVVRFEPTSFVSSKPNASLAAGAQLLDLAGDGSPDLVTYGGTAAGFYEHEATGESWKPFRAFKRNSNRNFSDPNAKFIDLSGDGRADLLITENDSLVWQESEGEAGFSDHKRVAKSLDEETGPRVVFADAEQSIYTADLSGDGLTDIVRIRNGEVCYWPNMGYGHFGAKITMDNSPRFDDVNHFDHQRIRLADIDGSGTTDIIYLHRDGVRLYFNQSGNRWSQPRKLNAFPKVDNLKHIVPLDLLGNGTTCLVWSSPLLADADRPMRYLNLMGGVKPHLLIKSKNNLGAETEIQYVPSTKFYLQDKHDGKPWITRLPFPVHVVERVITQDRISGNRFVTRYAYHHGYFDGKEREFRGFGMVEQYDTEEFAFLKSTDGTECPSNIDAASHVPPVLTKTWFHTGAYLGRNRISNYFAGFLDQHDRGEYYREPADCCTDEDARAALGLLPDTILPCDLTFAEEREACRALKGSMLRQEVYALDGSGTCEYPHGHPYTMTEQNFTVRKLQSKGDQRHGVFFTHPREVINYHYERNPVDPRISHALTLEVDDYGNILKDAAIAYGRRMNVVTIDRFGRKRVAPNPELVKLDPYDQAKQTQTQITFTENQFTNQVDLQGDKTDHYLTPQPSGTNTYELTGICPPDQAERFQFDQWTQDDFAICRCAKEIPYEATPNHQLHQKRLIESVRTRYRSDDLASILPDGQIEPRMLTGESFKLAFTPGLIDKTFTRNTPDGETETLLPNPSEVLAVDPTASATDRGGYVDLDCNGHWWIPSGRNFLSPAADDSPAEELAFAQQHFFLDRHIRDPFHTDSASTETFITYDEHDLLVVDTCDQVGNRVTAGERDQDGKLLSNGNDYRVLQPALVMDANRNRSAVEFDAMGMVVGTAVMGKPEERLGDSLDGFDPDLTEDIELQHLAIPLDDPHSILGTATTRLVYDLFAFNRSSNCEHPSPPVVYTIARETHESDLAVGQQTKVQHSFSYSDGFGREIQKKVQAEPGPVLSRDAAGAIAVDENNQPKLTEGERQHRWVGSGWTIFNNKGKPVRKFEPFFTDTHCFESDVRIGVSPVLFYDPAERVVATLHPNQTYEKVVFDPWKQATWDVNDTVLLDPRTDTDIACFVSPYLKDQSDVWQTWYQQRTANSTKSRLGVSLGSAEIEKTVAIAKTDSVAEDRHCKLEQQAAQKAAAHVNTPTTEYFDALGRPILSVAHNRDSTGNDEFFSTRTVLDIEGNQRAVVDALDRVVMSYDYDMLGNRIHSESMDAGRRWMLNDVTGKPLYNWDSRDHQFQIHYDALRRPLIRTVSRMGTPARHPNTDKPTGKSAHPTSPITIERTIYGESQPNPESKNLRTQVFRLHDQAGTVTTDNYDFKGNLLSTSRQLHTEFRTPIDWQTSTDADMQNEQHTSTVAFDALDRPTSQTSPDGSVVYLHYNEANLLERVTAELTGGSGTTTFVSNIDYDAKGQRTVIEYGNGAKTTYQYDLETFRLIRMSTRRDRASFPDDCPQPRSSDWPGCGIQQLAYHYDPVGNITHIHDDAQQTVFFNNRRVEPSNDYEYDATYRLINATGREHLGQNGQPMIPDPFGKAHSSLPHPGDGNALGNYQRGYLYDAVGNILKMQHRGDSGGWKRDYTYAVNSNRLHTTRVGQTTESYTHDAHGNMNTMSHLPTMRWDHDDQLQETSRARENESGESTFYVYDSAGERVRKVTTHTDGTLKHERIYLGGYEIYREYAAATEADKEQPIKLERTTLHIMDDQQRVAMVEHRMKGNDKSSGPKHLIRYQLGNHLGSSSIELNETAQIISYEEYFPFGDTAYQATNCNLESNLESNPKRYRYIGKERDEENGFSYHGARYYVGWLGRWVTTDPIGIADSLNLFQYSNNNPIVFRDSNGAEAEPQTLWNASVGVKLSIGSSRKELSVYAEGSFSSGSEDLAVEGGAKVEAYFATTKYGIQSSASGVGAAAYLGVGSSFGGRTRDTSFHSRDLRSFAGSGQSRNTVSVGYGLTQFSGHFRKAQNNSQLVSRTGSAYFNVQGSVKGSDLRLGGLYGNDNLPGGNGLDANESAFASVRLQTGGYLAEAGFFNVTDQIKHVGSIADLEPGYAVASDQKGFRHVSGPDTGAVSEGKQAGSALGTYTTLPPEFDGAAKGVKMHVLYGELSNGSLSVRLGVDGKFAHDRTQGWAHKDKYSLFPRKTDNSLHWNVSTNGQAGTGN